MRPPNRRDKIKIVKITKNRLTIRGAVWFNRLRLASKSTKALEIATVVLAGWMARKKCATKGKEKFYEKTVWFRY
jgi:hypothetical protein